MESINFSDCQYEILKSLGRGAFGTVFLVQEKKKKTKLAVKVIMRTGNQIKDRLRNKTELQVLSSTDHIFLIKLHHHLIKDNKMYFFLDYMESGTLTSKMIRDILLNRNLIKIYIGSLTLALEYLHKKDFIYRDLKPDNILLDNQNYLKIADFGLSKNISNKESGFKTFSFCGTVKYMAPEIILKSGHNKEVDLWSLGMLLFEMQTGVLPFNEGTHVDIMKKIVKAKIAMPKNIDEESKPLLKGLLKRNPNKRFGVQEMKDSVYLKNINWDHLIKKKYNLIDMKILSSELKNPELCKVISNQEDLNNSRSSDSSQEELEWFDDFDITYN